MDWNSIIIMLLSGTTLTGAVAAIRYWRQNKQLKNDEVKKSNNEVKQLEIETQKAEIDLANKYKHDMLEVLDMLKENQRENVGNQKEILENLDNLDKRMDRMEVRIGDIETYLNGGYKHYLSDKREQSLLKESDTAKTQGTAKKTEKTTTAKKTKSGKNIIKKTAK